MHPSNGENVTSHLATMIDEASIVAIHSGINDKLIINAEEVGGSDATLLVPLFAQLRHTLSDYMTDIFDYHLFCSDRL